MKTGNLTRMAVTLLFAATLIATGCDSATEPGSGNNQLGGETNLEMTQVGSVFDASVDVGQVLGGRMADSVVVVKNEAGLVTFRTRITVDSTYIVALDSALGTAALPRAAKLEYFDKYLKRFGGTIDTSNWNDVRLAFDLKLRVTSEGIQEYISSAGDLAKPQTIVRYAADVGEVVEFKDAEGLNVKRTVVSKSTTDDYNVGFWLLKVIKVEQVREDAVIEKVTYIANHKYGLIAVAVTTKFGKTLKLGIWPPTL